MDGPRDYHTKLSKSDRERQISYDVTYMWNLKKMIQMNLLTKQKQTHKHRKQTKQKQTHKHRKQTQTHKHRKQTNSQTQQGRDKLGVWD